MSSRPGFAWILDSISKSPAYGQAGTGFPEIHWVSVQVDPGHVISRTEIAGILSKDIGGILEVYYATVSRVVRREEAGMWRCKT
jgi:folate-dependent phosphoribosylglycinamide formyltransferase PurN